MQMSMQTGMQKSMQINLLKYTNKYTSTSMQTIKQWKYLAVLKILRLYGIMVVIYCYLEREIDNILKFDINNSFPLWPYGWRDFEIGSCCQHCFSILLSECTIRLFLILI